MIHEDTIKLLKECDAGIKMGVSSLNDMLKYVKDERLKKIIQDNKSDHERIDEDLQKMLAKYSDDGKDPGSIAQGMSWIKTNMKILIDNSDSTVADLTVDGCDMGVKSLSKYLNKYKAADEKSKEIAKRLIKLESDLSVDMRDFL